MNMKYCPYNKRSKTKIFFNKISKFLFKEYVDKGDNGVIGPGFHNYGYYKISFGKLSIILILFIIVPLLIASITKL